MTNTLLNQIVFCDFDGTITAEETFVAMLKRFTPEATAAVLPQIYHRQITLKQGVRTLLEALPASVYHDIIEYTRTKPIRPGFAELLNFLEAHHIPFVVISGGLKGMVEAVLEPFLPQIEGIYAMEVDVSGSRLKLRSPYEGETEMVAKADILAKYQQQHDLTETIAIGDSVTDWNLALAASTVFARPPLTDFLVEQGKSYIAWETFTDIQHHLASRLG